MKHADKTGFTGQPESTERSRDFITPGRPAHPFVNQVSAAAVGNLVHLVAHITVAVAVEDVDVDAAVEEVQANSSEGIHQLLGRQSVAQERLQSDRELHFLSPSLLQK